MKAYITLITLISTHHSISALSNNPRNYGIERRTLSGQIDDDYDYQSRQDDYGRYVDDDDDRYLVSYLESHLLVVNKSSNHVKLQSYAGFIGRSYRFT